MSDLFPPKNYIQISSKVSGIEVYAPAPEESDQQQAVVEFKCPQCGATTAYSVEDGGLKCSHCGYYSPPEKKVVGRQAVELEFTVENLQQAQHGWGEARNELECQTCGARTSVPVEALTHTCPFCGSNQVIQRQASADVIRPRFLIPFSIEADQCRNISRQWLGGSWMTPKSLRQVADQALFSGIYLPFWTFDATTMAAWKAEVGHPESERYYEDGQWKTRIVIRWRWETGQIRKQYDDLMIPGTARLSNLLLNRIKDFDISQLRPYEPSFLAGFHALAYDLQLDNAWESARQQMRESTRQACRDQASSSHIRNFSMNLDFSDEGWRCILLPIYLAGYPYRGRVFQVMINGQSGEVAGQRPVDWTKVWLVVGAILAPGLLLALIGLFTVLFGGVGILFGGIGFFLLVVGLIISAVLLRKAMGMDDI